MPSTIEQLHRGLGPRGLTVLALNLQEDRDKVAAWVRDKSVSVPVLLDPDGAVTAAYKVTGTPTVFLVGRDGTLVGKAVGTRDWGGPAGLALLAALLER